MELFILLVVCAFVNIIQAVFMILLVLKVFAVCSGQPVFEEPGLDGWIRPPLY